MTVSIVITTRNRAASLQRALQSAVDQTHGDIVEIIVSDNGSTDDTPDVIETMRTGRKRLVKAYREDDLVITDHWVKAIRRAKGDWVKVLFDDDWLAPDCVDQLLAATDQDTLVAQCGATFDWLDAPAYDDPGPGTLQDAVRAGRLSVSPVNCLHRRDALLRSFDQFALLPDFCIASGVGPCVLMNYGQVVREPWRHRHTPQRLVWLGGDDLEGDSRSTTSRLRDTDPGLLRSGHEAAYDLLDRLAAEA